MEAENVVCFEATGHAIWLCNFIHDLGIVYSIKRSLKMYCDNTAILSFFNNVSCTSGAKFIKVKYDKVKDEVAEGIIYICRPTS